MENGKQPPNHVTPPAALAQAAPQPPAIIAQLIITMDSAGGVQTRNVMGTGIIQRLGLIEASRLATEREWLILIGHSEQLAAQAQERAQARRSIEENKLGREPEPSKVTQLPRKGRK